MNYNDLVELDDDAEMIDLGVASLETLGVLNSSPDNSSDGNSLPGIAH